MNTVAAEFSATPFNTVAPLWQPGEDDTFECVQVRVETHDVKTFVFKAVPARQFRYLPGQFITLELEIDGETINRCYTLSSTPTRPDAVSITVKRVPGGKVSNWLHDHMAVGKRVSVLGPAGEFSFALHPQRPYLFLSGGSGITPLMSMSRALTDLAIPSDVVFVHSSRSPADIIFRQEVALLARQHANFRQVQVCQSNAGEPEWSGLTGFLDRAAMERAVPDFKDRTVFCCGPGPYMAGVRKLLEEAGFDMAHYHEESFNFGELSAALAPAESAPVAADGACGAGFKVRFAKTGTEVSVQPGQTVLAAAQAGGVPLPSSCSQGVCGTCKTKLVEGTVDMQHGGGIRQREIDQGMFLPCCSKPTSDLVLDR